MLQAKLYDGGSRGATAEHQAISLPLESHPYVFQESWEAV